jgi:hypothetical protein
MALLAQVFPNWRCSVTMSGSYRLFDPSRGKKMQTEYLRRTLVTISVLLVLPLLISRVSNAAEPANYGELVTLFKEWRAFARPAVKNGVQDYSPAAMRAKAVELPKWRKRLDAIDTKGWPTGQLNDWKLVQAEMNGLDFDLRVLRPWARDPAFYVCIWGSRTDVPSREGPTADDEIALYSYHWPLSVADQHDLVVRIAMVPALLIAARENLKDANARDLWVYGEQELREQSATLASLEAGTLSARTLESIQHPDISSASPELRTAVANARKATDDFVAWLEKLAPTKTGASGVGKENYTWYEQNVHLIPYTWEDQVALLKRELERAQASLLLEEHNNRNLPPLQPAADATAFNAMTQAHLDKFVDFLVKQEIIPDKPYIKPALEPMRDEFVPENQRIFFTRVTHREPMLLYSHDYHWIDLARMKYEPNPSPIRCVASLSNIWDTRAEGFATAFEEIAMHAGLYDDNPRAKELVWMMLGNRAARGLASLYVQANEWTLDQAGKFHSEWTPGGFSKLDHLTAFEQLLYLRQPGYGASYVTGKLLFDRLIMEYAHEMQLDGKPFVLRDFMDRFNNEGMIPMPLMETEIIPERAREP